MSVFQLNVWNASRKWFKGYVDANAIGGAVTLIARNGRQAHIETYGMRDARTPMTHDTIFRIASMTKPVTSVAVMMLYE